MHVWQSYENTASKMIIDVESAGREQRTAWWKAGAKRATVESFERRGSTEDGQTGPASAPRPASTSKKSGKDTSTCSAH